MFDGTLGTKMRSECTFIIASTDALFEKKTHQYLRQLQRCVSSTGNMEVLLSHICSIVCAYTYF